MTHPDILHAEAWGYPTWGMPNEHIIGQCPHCGEDIYNDDDYVQDDYDVYCNERCMSAFYGLIRDKEGDIYE